MLERRTPELFSVYFGAKTIFSLRDPDPSGWWRGMKTLGTSTLVSNQEAYGIGSRLSVWMVGGLRMWLGSRCRYFILFCTYVDEPWDLPTLDSTEFSSLSSPQVGSL